jgi:hypothetical protein
MVQRCISELSTAETTCTVSIDSLEIETPEVVIILIRNQRKRCFHIAVPWSNGGVKNAKVVCAQEVLYRTKEGGADVYFAVYDVYAQMVSFCLCSPSSQEIEDVLQRSMEGGQEQVAERLKAYVDSNTKVLS